jgi:hypothetical protein
VFKRDDSHWFVYITVDYKRINLGTYPSEIIAAKVYDRHALKYHGEFAGLNVYTDAQEKKWEKVKHLYDKDFIKRKKKRTKYYGVYYTGKGKYRAMIYVGKKSVSCGTFSDEKEAALAVNLKIKELKLDRVLNQFN